MAVTDVVRMRLAEANPELNPVGTNHCKEPPITFWATSCQVAHQRADLCTGPRCGVYPGVDLIYYGNQRQLEYDFWWRREPIPSPYDCTSTAQKR